MTKKTINLPSWFRQPIPQAKDFLYMKDILAPLGLHTVCQGAHCPNQGVCWSHKTATFMILGDVCTRACRFCAVKSGEPVVVNEEEPEKVAEAVLQLGLKYVVITSVTRDDLLDQGACHFAKTVSIVKEKNPQIIVEVLAPDFWGQTSLINMVIDAGVDVFGHNVETVRRCSSLLRSKAHHEVSLKTLTIAKQAQRVRVKSGLMVGLGETDEEVIETLQELKDAGCDMVTIGQYLAPSDTGRHFSVQRFVYPEKFDEYRQIAENMGFGFVASAPLVRSSYLAEAGYQSMLQQKER